MIPFKFFIGSPCVTLNMTTHEVQANVRELRAMWTPGMIRDIEDVSVNYNPDIERELITLLSEQMAAEVDREILQNLETIGFPTIRRVAATTIGLDLVSVQPLSYPSGLLFCFDPSDKLNNFKFFN